MQLIILELIIDALGQCKTLIGLGLGHEPTISTWLKVEGSCDLQRVNKGMVSKSKVNEF